MDKIALPVVEVLVKAKKDSTGGHRTRALLDSGSNRSFCTERLQMLVGAEGRPIDITLDTLCGEESGPTKEVDLEVKGVGMRKWSRALALHRVLVRPDFPTALKDAVTSRKDIEPWEHLQRIKLPPDTDTGITTELLIGLDNPQALEPLETRRGSDGAPFAVRTQLGWTVNGPLGYPRLSATSGCNVGLRVPQRRDSPLEVQVRRFWELETETEGTKHNEEKALSVDDKRVLKLWSSSIRVVDSHYQLPIPFRNERPKFPDNRVMAEERLAALRRRLLKQPHLHDRYKAEVQQLLDKGYAELVPAGEITVNPDYTWYLPHHPVFNPNKPEKVRIVFDCAAIYDSTSLNSEVLQGPDLTNKLLGILLRFRQGQVAIMADIEAMFHQIKVTPQHRDALRFLWWTEGDLSRRPCVYRMTVHPFGGVWSPSCAAYALQRALMDKQREYPEVHKHAKENFYVDDLLLSVNAAHEASTLSRHLRVVLAAKGFRLTKWMSNDKEVLASIPVQERHAEVKEIDFSHKTLPTERALGVRWDLQADQLAISANPGSKLATKRGLLSVVSSVYDPLGIVSPYTIRAKMIFQDECRRQKDWDEPLTEGNRREWDLWKSGLKELAHLSISRCYTRDMSETTNPAQLHHFCDASQKAYGIVSYLRFAGSNGVHCAFVCGKAKLAPLKQQTIPRLELCAAVLAVKMDQYLQRELDTRVQKSIFWTDSMLVLQYIANTERRFRTFVANRVSIIRDTSDPSQWRHVPTALNPADDATRGLSASEMTQQSRWLTGPPFLWLEESQWPDRPLLPADLVSDPEVISCSTATGTHRSDVPTEGKDLGLLWTHYSSWYRLQKGVAWIKKFIEWLQRKPDDRPSPSPLTVPQLRQAKTAILRKVQQEHYAAELETLQHGAPITRKSTIYTLEPWLDKEGLLRVGGRLSSGHLKTQDDPILLPREHPVTELIIREVHQTVAGHSGREHTVALVRQNYWVPQIRRKVDTILRRCFVCRRNNWKTPHQRQAPLPEERVTPGAAPFSSTGVDCFGPFLVKQGRGRAPLKRWGCIFTCMATRAVHLEVLMSMDADAFLNALTRFSARRGVPTRLRSDNGTNMTAAERELRAVAQTWSEDDHVRATLLTRHIEWTFHPPQASHMGGIWERQIRTVRKVLRAIVGSQVLDDERLHTFFCEAEAVINSRPLTPASEDPCDLEALTPNHILRAGTHCSPPLGGASTEEQFRKRWKHVQYLADQFWKRWLKEYLPRLRLRSGPIKERRNFKRGDLVIVASEGVPRNQWKLGRIVHVKPGTDGIVRQVKVRTARNVLVRPVTKLCFLEGLDRN